KDIHETGEAAIWLLILTLACTPLAALFKIKHYRRFRKIFGIYTFLFSVLHVIVFVSTRQWDLRSVTGSLFSEVYLLVGGMAFLLLLALALTSNRISIKKLRKNWKKLHNSVYIIAGLVFVHIILVKDQFYPQNLVYGAIFGILLVLRLPAIKVIFNRLYRVPDFIRSGNKIESNSLRQYLFFVLFVIGASFALVTALQSFANAVVEEEYRYDMDRVFYSAWFMPSEIPIVKHENTNRYCNDGCHWTFPPGLLPQESWELQMTGLQNHFGKSIDLDPDIKQDIERYLVQHAAEYTKARVSVDILDSLAGEVPTKFGDIPFITKNHKDIQPEVYQRESIRSISNCPACHKGVEKTGSFKDRYVEIPDF
ncbi:ferric reductase-like transmembrane domain-containing protein, partial [bacterium]|nr:ferric reductase-like transmembrane domain-containing protein [bacterium]